MSPLDTHNIDNKSKNGKRGFDWLYTTSYVLILISMLTLSSVLPIDVIVQSKNNNSHLATNTVIILVIIAVFILFAILIHMVRLFYNKMLIQDIPKPYIPITANDIGKTANANIKLEMIRCETIKKLAKPKGNIKHPGLYHSTSTNNENDNDGGDDLPDNLIYENVIKVIGQELKYNNSITISNTKLLKFDNHYSLRELINTNNDEKIENFLNLYEKLRFGGNSITCQEFKQFLKGWNYVKNKIG